MMATDSINKIWWSFLVAIVFVFPHAISAATSPQDVFNKCRTKISSAKTLSADFKMTLNGKVIQGNLYSKGKKFTLLSNETSNWYNGTDLYTYNSAQKETSVFKPTQEELAEVNPLLFIKSASNFKVTASKTKKAGVETVVLLPSGKGSGVKSVAIEIDAKTYLPKSMKIIPESGQPISLTISNIKLDKSLGDATFEYPKSKYPKVRIIDFR